MKAADIPDAAVVEIIRACNEARCEGDSSWGYHGGRPGYGAHSGQPEGHWANRWDIGKALDDQYPEKVVLAKLRRLVKRGLINGCACGCRGEFTAS